MTDKIDSKLAVALAKNSGRKVDAYVTFTPDLAMEDGLFYRIWDLTNKGVLHMDRTQTALTEGTKCEGHAVISLTDKTADALAAMPEVASIRRATVRDIFTAWRKGYLHRDIVENIVNRLLPFRRRDPQPTP